MTGTALVRPRAAIFWDLRGCWATGRRVALSLDADLRRAEGHVTKVAATDAYVYVDDLLVPGERILAVHYPSRLGDSTVWAGARWAAPGRRPAVQDGQETFE